MSKRTVIPFGPQHPVLPEPIHLDLVLEDETVVEALPSIGYIHKGLEGLVDKREFHEMYYVAERICGICSFIHGMGYCQAVEGVMGIEVPERALYLRNIWSEYSRLHSHLLWLGLFADSLGFENLFMNCWRLRERILDAFEETTGNRVVQGSCKVGGVRRDISPETLERLGKDLADMEKELGEITNVFLKDDTVKHRTKGVGILSKEDAYTLGALGPTLRGSGVSSDARMLGYAAYDRIKFAPVVETGGDSYARCAVRIGELFQSIDVIHQSIKNMTEGPIDVKVSGNPTGEYFSRTEQPRGEVIHYVRGNGTKHLERFRARTPTFSNIPPLVKMLAGCQLADVPVIVLSIDPCISCTER
ncbi:MAG: nickel-dependent hydrogenase large subunit [Candidatus Altiarchaeota archaeon]|nr:nickel-dependent hydrogenase large subunit [Candidatus Altiarchaeota archaeon]